MLINEYALLIIVQLTIACIIDQPSAVFKLLHHSQLCVLGDKVYIQFLITMSL